MKVSELAEKLKFEVADLIEIIKETGTEVSDGNSELDNASINGLVEKIDQFSNAVKNNQQKKDLEAQESLSKNSSPIPEAGSEKPQDNLAKSPASSIPNKQLNPSLKELSVNLNIEISVLLAMVNDLGLKVEDIEKELDSSVSEQLLSKLKLKESTVINTKDNVGHDIPNPAIKTNTLAQGVIVEVDMGQANVEVPLVEVKSVPVIEKKKVLPVEKKVVKKSSPSIFTPIISGVVNVLANPFFIIGMFSAAGLIIITALIYSTSLKKAIPVPTGKQQMELIWKMDSQGYYESAYEAAKVFIEDFPNSKLIEDVYFKTAQILLSWKRYPPALQYNSSIKAFEEAIKKFPDSDKVSAALIDIAQSYRAMNLYDKAVATYKRLLRDNPFYYQKDKIQMEIATICFDGKKFGVALKEYGKLIREYPYSPFRSKALLQIAVCFEKNAQSQAAINAYKNYLKVSKDAAGIEEAKFYIGNVYLKVGEFENAIKYFTSAIAKYPNDNNNSKAQLLISESFIGLKNFAEAIKSLQIVIYEYTNTPQAEQAMFKLGEYYAKNNQKEKGIIAYEKALEKYPNSRFARISSMDLGKLYVDLGNLDKAILIYFGLLKKYPSAIGNEKIFMLLARTYYARGMYVASAKIADDLIKNYPSSKLVDWAYYFKSDSYVKAGLFDEAKKVIIRKMTANSNATNKDFLFYKLGEIAYFAKQYDEAIGYFNESIGKKLFSRYRYKCRLLIAKSNFAKKDYKSAIEQLEKLINNDFLKGKEIYYESCVELAKIYALQKELTKSNELFDRVISLGAKNNLYLVAVTEQSNNYVNNGALKQAQTIYQDALDNYEKIKKSEDDYRVQRGEIYLGLADILYQKKEFKAALESYMKADDLIFATSTKKAWVIYQIGNCYNLLSQPELAKSYFEKLKTSFPTNFWTKQIDWNIKRTELLNNIGIGVRHE